MPLLSNSWIIDIFTVVISAVTILLIWIKLQYNYWQIRGLPSPPVVFFYGHMKNVLQQTDSFGVVCKNIYTYFKNHNIKHGGIYFFFMPLYIPVDPNIIKNILQNDFQHFVDRGIYYNEEGDPLSAHLFSINGSKWRNLRIKLTPTFTSGKMKMMIQTLVDISDQLTLEMDKFSDKNSVNIKEILSRFTTDVIGSCAFGLSCNSLLNPNCEFKKYGDRFFNNNFIENLTSMMTFLMPKVMKKFNTKAVKKDSSDFFLRVLQETVDYREKNNIHRKDFMHLLLQLKNRGKLVDDGNILKNAGEEIDENFLINFNELAAQAFVFFIAGFETSSTVMTFCLYELATNKDVQEKLMHEVREVLQKYDGKITYEAISEMVYMEKVLNETLRKYPPIPFLNRICTKEYKVPGTDVVLETGTKLVIPTLGLHYDPEYYPDPQVFNPERFSEENKQKIPPFTFLPFGDGPRICIGLRFGVMQAKVGLAALLNKYQFSVSTKTQLPIKMDPGTAIMSAIGGIWLDYTKI